MFASPTSARLQEIGPRFTLKLRWLRKGLPSVTAPDGRIAHGGDPGEEDNAPDEEEVARQEKADEDVAMGEIGKTPSAPVADASTNAVIPPLDEEQEYEWKWKVSSWVSQYACRADADGSSQRWRSRGGLSSCNSCEQDLDILYYMHWLCGVVIVCDGVRAAALSTQSRRLRLCPATYSLTPYSRYPPGSLPVSIKVT